MVGPALTAVKEPGCLEPQVSQAVDVERIGFFIAGDFNVLPVTGCPIAR
jgi:hypothetical protein